MVEAHNVDYLMIGTVMQRVVLWCVFDGQLRTWWQPKGCLAPVNAPTIEEYRASACIVRQPNAKVKNKSL